MLYMHTQLHMYTPFMGFCDHHDDVGVLRFQREKQDRERRVKAAATSAAEAAAAVFVMISQREKREKDQKLVMRIFLCRGQTSRRRSESPKEFTGPLLQLPSLGLFLFYSSLFPSLSLQTALTNKEAVVEADIERFSFSPGGFLGYRIEKT